MTVVFVSNYYNHHQAPFAAEMDRLTGHRFSFIETEPIAQERLNMGWGREEKPEYVISSYTGAAAEKNCARLIMEADAVIWGGCSFRIIRPRVRAGKLTFCYSERIFKRGLQGFPFWGRVIKYKGKLGRYQSPRHCLLCASAYAASDYARMGLFQDRAFAWGYFPAVKQQNLDELFARKRENGRPVLLWAGRLIDWKHPEAAVMTAARLRDEGCEFELKFIGSGELEEKLRGLIREKGLEEQVQMLGAMPPEKVREHMEASDIFLFTSDQNEGWGAVLNESMNSACAVIASRAIGSAPFLIRDGENGMIYEDGDTDDLYRKVKMLIEDAPLREQMGREAYKTLSEKWNAQVAAEELLRLTESLLNGRAPVLPEDGPCSRAQAHI